MNQTIINLRGRFSSGSNQRGITLVEVLAVLAIAAGIIAFALPKIREAFFSTTLEQGFAEVNDVIIVARQFRQVNGTYTGITIQKLVEDGYGLQKYGADDGFGSGQNAYGGDVTIAEDSGDADVEYQFGDEKSCIQIAARLSSNTDLSGIDEDDPGSSCSADGDFHKLEFTIN